MSNREYVKLAPGFWTGPTGRQLRRAGIEAQLVALYLLSNRHSGYNGLFQLPLNYITADTGLSEAAVRAAMAAVEAVGFARYDENSETCWVVNAAQWQLGELRGGDNRIKAQQKEFDAIPEDCPFKSEFLAKYSKPLGIRGAAQAPAPKQAELVPPTPAAKPAPAPAAKPEPKPEPKSEPEPDESPLPEPVKQVQLGNEIIDLPDTPQDGYWQQIFIDDLGKLIDYRYVRKVGNPVRDKEIVQAWLRIAEKFGYQAASTAVTVARNRIKIDVSDFDELVALTEDAIADDI